MDKREYERRKDECTREMNYQYQEMCQAERMGDNEAAKRHERNYVAEKRHLEELEEEKNRLTL